MSSSRPSFLSQRRHELGGQHEEVAGLGISRVRVVEVGVHGREHVRRQRPWRGGPDHQRRVFVAQRQADVRGRVVDCFVGVADLAGGQCGAALRPPPDDLVALVKQALVEQLRQRPPDRLDVRLVVGDVRFVDVDPEARCFSVSCSHSDV